MAGSSVFPGGLDEFSANTPNPTSTFTATTDSTGRPHGQRHDDVEAAVMAIEGELGVNPSGASGTVAEAIAAASEDGDGPTTRHAHRQGTGCAGAGRIWPLSACR